MNNPIKHFQIGPLSNVLLFNELVHELLHREPGLPGLGLFYGPAGFGKTYAATAVYMRSLCPLVEVDELVTKKSFLKDIAKEMALPAAPRTTMSELREMIVEEFLAQEKPLLIIDEADFLVSKKIIETLRAITNKAKHLSVVLIGEEKLPHHLREWERVSSRILIKQPAAPCGLEDAQGLAGIYAPGVTLGADLLQEIVALAEGSSRRVSTNLSMIASLSATHGLREMDQATFERLSDKPLHQNSLSKPRSFRR